MEKNKSKASNSMRRLLGLAAKGTVDFAVAGKRLGQALDRKLGTEKMSAFPIKKGYKPKSGKMNKVGVVKKGKK
jgi:hypothetical protein